jgi:tRNA-Thr(GGU) m(6)t(6)A37 methyltransferase TsaA
LEITLKPVAFVKCGVKERKDVGWGADVSTILLDETYVGGLAGLSDFSHALIVTYLDQAKFDREKHLQRRPQNRPDMPLTGIFAQRGKDRPNQIGVTAVEILAVSQDALTVRGLDAVDGTPVLDIKPYFPMYDKREASVPEWVLRLMEHYF